MLDYGWGNPGSIMLTDEETGHVSEQNRPEYHFYNNTTTTDHHQNYSHQTTTPNFNFINTEPEPHFTPITFHHHQQNPTNFTNFYHDSGPTGLEHSGPTGFLHLPKSEPLVVGGLDFNTELMINSRLGLNLGGRTYFASSEEDDFVNRLYRRSRLLEPGLMNNYPRCQAEGCNADLSGAKHYHRRHKVCEFHSKAATAVVAGLTQRFCQQCSRFHLLSEFDNGKRSCRRRLADHNRRRRKCNQENNSNKSQAESSAPNSSSENLTRSPHDSSSVTVAISPPRISLECLGYGSH